MKLTVILFIVLGLILLVVFSYYCPFFPVDIRTGEWRENIASPTRAHAHTPGTGER